MRLRVPALAGLAVLAVVVIVVLREDNDAAPRLDRAATTADRPTSTRMVGRPLLFRFVGPQRFAPRLTYMIIFRLNRDPKQPGVDPRHQLPNVSNTSRGNYKLAKDIIFATDAPIFTLGRRSPRHCFHGVLGAGTHPDLDKRPAGAPVRFVAQPLTPTPGPDKLGRRYVINPRIMVTDIDFKRPSARRALARLGCLKSALQEPTA